MTNFLSRHFPILVIVAVVLGVVVWQTFFELRYAPDDSSYNKAYWSQRISVVGAGEAYQDFVQKNSEVSYERQHLASHVFGELLYQAKGKDGLTVCTAQFGFGCYHGFFGQALSHEGTDSLQSLDAVCLASFGPLGTGCQHGIGHGALEYVGYEHLNEALLLCEKTTQKVPLLGCASGVFMEYNSPLVGISDGLVPTVREFDPEIADKPCITASEKYRKSCYFELGGWLVHALSQDYAGVSEVCGNAASEYRSFCYRGFGASLAPTLRYDLEKSLPVCDSFDAKNAVFCRAGVAWALYSDPEYRSRAIMACDYDNPEMRNICILNADNTEGLGTFPD